VVDLTTVPKKEHTCTCIYRYIVPKATRFFSHYRCHSRRHRICTEPFKPSKTLPRRLLDQASNTKTVWGRLQTWSFCPVHVRPPSFLFLSFFFTVHTSLLNSLNWGLKQENTVMKLSC